MKKTILPLLTLLLLATACQSPAERYISKLKDFVEEVTEEGSEYTGEQWEAVVEEIEVLLQEAEQLTDLTDEQKQEIAKLQGKLGGTVVKKGFDNLLDQAGEELDKAGKAIEGFLEGFGEEE